MVNNPLALSALREMWGFPCELGDVTMEAKGDAIRATIAAGGMTLAEVALEGSQPIDVDQARFDPSLTLRLVPSVQENVPTT